MPITTTPTTEAATLPAFITDLPKRKRRPFKRVAISGEPTVTIVSPGVVSVSLFGSRAAGRSMILDTTAWADISERLTPRWVVNSDGKGREYVRSGANIVAGFARQRGERPTVSLARLVARARRGQVVSYLDGDRLNLTRLNLTVNDKPVEDTAHV